MNTEKQNIFYSVIVPSKDKENLINCVENILKNSSNLYEILIYWNGEHEDYDILCRMSQDLNHWLSYVKVIYCKEDVYRLYNMGVKSAEEELCLLINDDMYFPPHWDTGLSVLNARGFDIKKCVITTQLVESGYVNVNPKNIQLYFGINWETFDKGSFDNLNREYVDTHEWFQRNFGWYMPVFISKTLFGEGYPTVESFPEPNDIKFFDALIHQEDVEFLQLNSLVYHFQRLSQRPITTEKNFSTNKITKLNLCCGNDHRSGYLNVDKDNPLGFDISSGQIQFDDDSFEEILFLHALEHFRFEIGKRLLKEIRRILKKDGRLLIAVPDLMKACNDYINDLNREGCAIPILRIYGQNTSEELVHKFGYSIESLTHILKMTGFKVSVLRPRYDDEIYMEAIK